MKSFHFLKINFQKSFSENQFSEIIFWEQTEPNSRQKDRETLVIHSITLLQVQDFISLSQTVRRKGQSRRGEAGKGPNLTGRLERPSLVVFALQSPSSSTGIFPYTSILLASIACSLCSKKRKEKETSEICTVTPTIIEVAGLLPGSNEEEEMASKRSGGVAGFCVLPRDCLVKIISLATTREACSLSSVSKDVRSTADSDSVWDKFLPPDYQDIINRSINPSSILALRSKKEIYRRLCDRPLLIDGGTKTFSLKKQNGKKCYMLAARGLEIAWGHEPTYWKWTPMPESRFEEVALLNFIWRLEIHGRISTSMLSLDTTYAAYLVFGIATNSIGLKAKKMEVSFGIVGDNLETRLVCLEPDREKGRWGLYGWHGHPGPSDVQHPMGREDGWLEVELGEFFNKKEAEEVEMSVKETRRETMKKGLIVEGIEIRPKKKGI